MSTYNGEVFYRGMTESDWKRLHSRVIPNPVPLEEFKDVVLTGRLQDRYLAKDLHKMMQELRDLLREHGELREASVFPLSGKKHELSQAAAAAVRVIDAHRERIPALRRSPPGSSAAATTDALDGRDGSTSPTLDSGSDQMRLSNSEQALTAAFPASVNTPSVSPRRSSRILPLVDHIPHTEGEEQPLVSSFPVHEGEARAGGLSAPQQSSSSRQREPALSRGSSAERQAKEPKTHLSNSWTRNNALSSTIAQHAAVSAPLPSTSPTASPATAAPRVSAPSPAIGLSLAASNVSNNGGSSGAPSIASAGPTNELAQLNEAAPPFFRILNVARRFQLRFGSSPLKFEIPVQYTEAVNSRRLRVFLIPLRHPNIPARWPTAKEIVVYVNEQCVMTPWKRSWPDRKQEVAKTFLPLDITYLLSRNMTSQRMQVDVFNKEYLSPAIVAIAQPRSLEEVTEAMLTARLGCRSVAQVQQAFAQLERARQDAEVKDDGSSGSPPPALLMANTAAMQKTYASIMYEDDDEDGLEADDPVITTKCPISQLPLAVPVRGRRCSHLQCVDLDSFLVSSHKGAYWNCALCDAEMRPRDVQIDTVLWSYLVSCGSAEAYPAYLRLSARPAASSAVMAGEGRYYWHPSSRTGDDADVISTDEDEENGDAAPRTDDYGGLPQPLATSPTARLHDASRSLALSASRTSNSSAAVSGTGGDEMAANRKRAREDDIVDEQRGTADDPIEL